MRNVSENEQVLRFMVATTLLLIALMEEGHWFWLLLPAGVLYVTGWRRFCPFYVMLHRRR